MWGRNMVIQESLCVSESFVGMLTVCVYCKGRRTGSVDDKSIGEAAF